MAWKHNLDTARLDASWQTMARVTQRLVNRYRASSLALPEDLFQACMVAVPAVLARWDGKRSLATWAWQPLRNALFDEMRNAALVVLPEEKVLEISRRERHRKALDRAVAALSRAPVSEEMLDDIHTLLKRLERADRNAAAPTSLDDLGAMAEDNLLDFESHVRRKRLLSALRGAAHSSREQVILRKVLCQGLSAHSVAQELGISHTSVNNAVKTLLGRLRARLEGKVEIHAQPWEYGDCA